MYTSRLLVSRRSLLGAGAATVLSGMHVPRALADAVPLRAELAAIRFRYGLPGVAAMVLRRGAVAAQGVAGVRSVSSNEPIRLDDPFVIGSCGKSMTATIAARLVARG